jgi:hypothetical protein
LTRVPLRVPFLPRTVRPGPSVRVSPAAAVRRALEALSSTTVPAPPSVWLPLKVRMPNVPATLLPRARVLLSVRPLATVTTPPAVLMSSAPSTRTPLSVPDRPLIVVPAATSAPARVPPERVKVPLSSTVADTSSVPPDRMKEAFEVTLKPWIESVLSVKR